ncbi:ATP19 family protein [Aspergillus lucknowensis]|uniref:ATP synthase subunit K, mitochondrial n=1 Tax=Aspergillus lucknowensis TaxID=176173 RepID=A0ABR4LR06_9EURO
MVVYYQIAGRQVGSHTLSLGILTSLFGGIYLATRGSGSQQKPAAPPIQASSKDEENFIQDFLKQVNAEEKKSDH